MLSLLITFSTGMLISFLGSLPLGSLNIAAMQVAITENIRRAFYFSLGVALVEVAYVRVSLSGINWILSHQRFFFWLEWASVFIFCGLAISSFIAAAKKQGTAKNILLDNKVNRFWLGFSMSALNPVQIPFWFIWSTYLINNQILLPSALHYNVYTAGIAAGTLAGLAIFILFGKWLLHKFHAGNQLINGIVGAVFLVSAVLQLIRLLRHSNDFLHTTI